MEEVRKPDVTGASLANEGDQALTGDSKAHEDSLGRSGKEHDLSETVLVIAEFIPDSLIHRATLHATDSLQLIVETTAAELSLDPTLFNVEEFYQLYREGRSLSAVQIKDSPIERTFTGARSSELLLHIRYGEPPPRPQPPSNGLPAKISVSVDRGDGQQEVIDVAIEPFTGRKRYLGGYKNKKNNRLFHHASAQTDVVREVGKVKDYSQRVTRETQTVHISSRSQQTKRENGSQMQRKDLVIDSSHDRVLHPRGYFTSEQHNLRKIAKTIVIQRYWRKYKATCLVAAIRAERQRKQEEWRQRQADKQREVEKKRKIELERRINPRTKEDFQLLYNELEEWKEKEQAKIKAEGLSREETHEKLEKLLHAETRLLQEIDRLKIETNKSNRDEKVLERMQKLAKPKQWQLGDGKTVDIHTPTTIRAQELLELHRALLASSLTVDERLEVLLNIKWTVLEFECPLTKEIVELVEREADLLNRGRSQKSLDGLRKRIGYLFQQFVETPEFNPEARVLIKVSQGYSTVSLASAASGMSPLTDGLLRLDTQPTLEMKR